MLVPTSLALRSRLAVDRIFADLQDEFGEFPIETETVEDDPALFEDGREWVEAGGRGGAGTRTTDEDGRVLCIRDARAPEQWGLPAGGHEPPEGVRETARRETREETGVRVELTDVWAAKRRRFVHRDDPQTRGYLVAVFFEARPVGGSPDPSPDDWEDDEEILEARWIDPEHVDRSILPLVTDSTAYVP